MKVLQINSVCGSGSTGRICKEISEKLSRNNIDNKVLYYSGTSDFVNSQKCSNDFYIKFQALKSRIFGNYGFNSAISTQKTIKELEKFAPDIVHIHNIHGHDVNIKKLFDYLKDNNLQIVWTFHDCWAFTGYCTYFTFGKCEKWKIGCKNCPQRKKYSFFADKSSKLFKLKNEISKNENITVVTPSQWLADLSRQSIFNNRRITVINNGIDLTVFKPTESDFRQKYGINDSQTVILGVAFCWEKRKGLDVFIELSKRLDKNKFKIVLVGTNDNIDKVLPQDIVSIHRTNNQQELAEIYSSADILLNPTREENFPTVNIEALACGIPVVTFVTGGSPEIIDETCGEVVADDIDVITTKIEDIRINKPYSSSDCRKRAESFSKEEKYNEYLDLYKSLYDRKSK